MADGKKTACPMSFNQRNQITAIVTKFKEIETNFTNWIAKPPLAVEAAVATVNNGLDGAIISYVFDTVAIRFCSVFHVPSSPLKAVTESRVTNARDMGVLLGVDAGISCVMKRIRGKEDIQTRMVAGFGAGVMFSVVRRKRPALVVMSGVFFALMEAVMFKVLMLFYASGFSFLDIMYS